MTMAATEAVVMVVATEVVEEGTYTRKVQCKWILYFLALLLITAIPCACSSLYLLWYLGPWRMQIAIALLVAITTGPPSGPSGS